MIIYGIKNCDTIKKTLNWFKDNNIPFVFHDYKKEGISERKLQEWSDKVGWENLINRRGTTWRKLDDTTKESINDVKHAVELMLIQTSLIKRPVVETPDLSIIVGFDEESLNKRIKELK